MSVASVARKPGRGVRLLSRWGRPGLAKEVRVLLPAWLLTLGLPVAVVGLDGALEWEGNSAPLAWLIFSLGCAVLGTLPFGHEFTHRTDLLVLAQPVERRRIWRQKMSVLAAGLLAALGVALTATAALAATRPAWFGDARWLWPAVGCLVVPVLCAFCAGPWLTLLTRNVAAALVFSVILPLAILLGAGFLVSAGTRLGGFPEANGTLLLTGLALGGLAAYCITGLYGAHRRFLRLETPESGGDAIELPEELAAPFRALLARVGRRSRRDNAGRLASARSATWQLVAKELRLQQMNFVLAGGLAVVFLLGAAIARLSGSREAAQYLALGPELGLLLWAFIPVLIGAVAVAEERRLGVLETQQMLPASRRRQWRVKCGCVYLTAFALGVVVPWGCALAVAATIRDQANDALTFERAVWTLPGLAVSWLAGTTLALFASAQARNLLQALGLLLAWLLGALALGAGIGAVARSVRSDLVPPGEAGPELLLGLILIPAIWLVLRRLSYRSYLESQPRPHTSLRQAAAVLVTVAAGTALALVLHARAWERILPEPRPSDRVRLEGKGPTALAPNAAAVLALCPDGRLEARTVVDPVRVPGALTLRLPQYVFDPEWRWRAVAASHSGAVAIRSDGTLWLLGSSPGPARPRPGGSASTPIQASTDNDWKTVAAGAAHFLALKTDGSLWAWGQNSCGEVGDGTTLPRESPVGIEQGKAWKDVTAANFTTVALDENGAIWSWGLVAQSAYGFDRQTSPVRLGLEPGWIHATPAARGVVAIRADRTLWLAEAPFAVARGGSIPSAPPMTLWPLSEEPGWEQAWSGGRYLYGLKADGSLWRWRTSLYPRPADESPVRPDQREPVGHHRQWITAGTGWGDFGLTTDGQLWSLEGMLGRGWLDRTLLSASRRPWPVAQMAARNPSPEEASP